MQSHIRSVLALVCVVAGAMPVAWAKRMPLNDTGMTACVDPKHHWSSDCAESRQDAAEGRDVHDANPDDGVAGFSFRKVCRSGEMAGEGTCPFDPALGSGPDDWGCVYDNITQLTWEAKTDDAGLHDGSTYYTNKGGKARGLPGDAAWLKDTTNAEGLCSATNWRLPDAFELQSLVDYGMGAPGRAGPFIDAEYFPNVRWQGTAWWTRNETAFHDKWAWFVDFSDGGVSAIHRFYGTMSAMLVHGTPHSVARSPHSQPATARDRFIPSPDGTQVTDTLTGLVWRRCAEGMAWNKGTQTCEGAAKVFSWKEALDLAWVRRDGGWRVPNIKELFSIVSLQHSDPAIDPVAFPNTEWLIGYASSTPGDRSGKTQVQNVYFGAGTVYPYDSDRWRLRLVRHRGRD